MVFHTPDLTIAPALYLRLKNIKTDERRYIKFNYNEYSGNPDEEIYGYQDQGDVPESSVYAINVPVGEYKIDFLLHTLYGPLSFTGKYEYRHLNIKKEDVLQKFYVKEGEAVYIGDFYGQTWESVDGLFTYTFYTSCCDYTNSYTAELIRVENNFKCTSDVLRKIYTRFNNKKISFRNRID